MLQNHRGLIKFIERTAFLEHINNGILRKSNKVWFLTYCYHSRQFILGLSIERDENRMGKGKNRCHY